MTAKSIEPSRSRGELFLAVPIAAFIVGACIVASEVIKANLTAAGSIGLLLLGAAIWLCAIQYVTEELIRRPQAAKLRERTAEYAKHIRRLTNDQLVQLFIIHTCPQVRNIYLRNDNGVCLKGKYTTHFIRFDADGASIYSEKHTYKAQREACAIAQFLAGACE